MISREQVMNNLMFLKENNKNLKHKWCLENIEQYITQQPIVEEVLIDIPTVESFNNEGFKPLKYADKTRVNNLDK